MNLPHFLIAGAPKSGTTSLYRILSQHPQIFLPEVKELHYFDNEEYFSNGINWYASHFQNARHNQICGECTAAYLYYPGVPSRMKSALGDELRIIFILRNPVDRAYSEYLHNYRRGLIHEDTFEKAIESEFKNQSLPLFDRRHFSYISRGWYSRYLKNYFQVFSREQVLILLFEEDFLHNPEQTISKILSFIGADQKKLNMNIKANEAYYPVSRKLGSLTVKKNPLRTALRKVIPSYQSRMTIRNFIRKYNRIKGKQFPELSPYEKTEIFNKYFQEDVLQLESLLQKPVDSWKR